MNSTLITVIIPAYNHENYITKAIQSVIDQTYQNIELIIINDGSSDNTDKTILKIEEKCRKRFSNYIYITRENKGLIKTLNEALDISNGKYLTMLGSDDYYYENKIELQVNYFNSNPDYVLNYGNITFVNSLNEPIKNGKTKKFKSGYIFNDLIFNNFIPLPTVMIKTDIVKFESGFDERYFFEDYPLWLKLSKKYKIGYIKDTLTFYRLHDSNASGDMLKMIKEVEKVLLDWKDEPIYTKAINRWYLRWFADLSKTNNLNEIKEYMQKAFTSSFYKPRYIKASIRYLIKIIKI